MRGKVGALGEVLPEEPVGVLVAAALPGGSRVGEVDVEIRRDAERAVFCHLGALVPGQRLPKRCRQVPDCGDQRVAESFRVSFATEVGQHHEASRPLDQGGDRGAAQSADDEVALPVAGNLSGLDLGRSFADWPHLIDEPLTPSVWLLSRFPGDATSPQLRSELPSQLATGVDVDRLVDRLRAHPHLLRAWEVFDQSIADLLGRPLPRKLPLNVGAEPVVGGDFRCPWPCSPCHGQSVRSVWEVAARRDGVALQLAADRRRRPLHHDRDRADGQASAVEIVKMLTLHDAEVSGVDDLLDDVQVDASTDGTGSSFRHDPIVPLGIPDHAPIGIDPAPLDDRDPLVPVRRRPGIRTNGRTGLSAGEAGGSESEELVPSWIDPACFARGDTGLSRPRICGRTVNT